jgi:hypothetical protein
MSTPATIDFRVFETEASGSNGDGGSTGRVPSARIHRPDSRVIVSSPCGRLLARRWSAGMGVAAGPPSFSTCVHGFGPSRAGRIGRSAVWRCVQHGEHLRPGLPPGPVGGQVERQPSGSACDPGRHAYGLLAQGPGGRLGVERRGQGARARIRLWGIAARASQRPHRSARRISGSRPPYAMRVGSSNAVESLAGAWEDALLFLPDVVLEKPHHRRPQGIFSFPAFTAGRHQPVDPGSGTPPAASPRGRGSAGPASAHSIRRPDPAPADRDYSRPAGRRPAARSPMSRVRTHHRNATATMTTTSRGSATAC